MPRDLLLNEDISIKESQPEDLLIDRPISFGAFRPNIPFLPGREKVERLISGRRNPIEVLLEEGRKPARPGNILQPFVFGAKALSTPFRLGEAAITNPALALQAGEGPKEIIRSLGQGITGKRMGEFGDIIRTTGFGGIFNEPIASITGLLALAGTTNLATKGKIVSGAQKIKNAYQGFKDKLKFKKDFSYKIEADKLSSGVDEVIGNVNKEVDSLYDKIGKRNLAGDDYVNLQDIVQKLPTRIITKLKEIASNIPGLLEDKTKMILKPNLRNARIIKTQIGKGVRRGVWKGIQDPTQEEAQLIESYHKVKNIMLKNSGKYRPQLEDINSRLSRLYDYDRIITKLTKTPEGVTKTNISKIRTPEMQGYLYELQKFGKEFFPEITDIVKRIDHLNRIATAQKWIQRGVIAGGAYGLGRGLIVNPLLKGIEELGGEGENYGGNE